MLYIYICYIYIWLICHDISQLWFPKQQTNNWGGLLNLRPESDGAMDHPRTADAYEALAGRLKSVVYMANMN